MALSYKLYQIATDEALAQVEKNINELGPITEYLKAHPDGKCLMERVLDGLTVNEVYNEPITSNVVVDGIALVPYL